jgi:hypothetical protein
MVALGNRALVASRVPVELSDNDVGNRASGLTRQASAAAFGHPKSAGDQP